MVKKIISGFSIKNKIKLFLMIILTAAGGILSILPIKCMEEMADLAVTQSSDNIGTVVILGLAYMALEIISNYSRYYGEYLVNFFQYQITSLMQIQLYEKLMRIDFQELKTHDSTELANVIIEDTVFLSGNLLKPFTDLLLLVITFICGLYYMIRISWVLTLMVIPLGVITSISARIIQSRAMSNIELKRNASAKLWKTFSEGLRGVIPLRICHAQKRYGEVVKNDSDRLKMSNIKQSGLEKLNSAVASTLFMLTIGMILLASCLLVIYGRITIGGMTAVLMYNHMLVDPLVNLIDVQQTFIKRRVSLKRISEVMDIKEQCAQPCVKIDSLTTDKISCQIGDVTVLKDASITLSKGQNVAIVGPTGCGKSTFANILAGLMLPTGGRIIYSNGGTLMHGVPNMGYLYQDGYLFDTDIKQNILIANPNLSDEDYEEIIGQCCLSELVSEHKDSIGENGAKLSGGERKRVRIARVLANKNADIYVFDELSTSLDDETARKIASNVLGALNDKICVFIEHNMDIAALMDKTVVIKDGKTMY